LTKRRLLRLYFGSNRRGLRFQYTPAPLPHATAPQRERARRTEGWWTHDRREGPTHYPQRTTPRHGHHPGRAVPHPPPPAAPARAPRGCREWSASARRGAARAGAGGRLAVVAARHAIVRRTVDLPITPDSYAHPVRNAAPSGGTCDNRHRCSPRARAILAPSRARWRGGPGVRGDGGRSIGADRAARG
jgi:hypothetical protein